MGKLISAAPRLQNFQKTPLAMRGDGEHRSESRQEFMEQLGMFHPEDGTGLTNQHTVAGGISAGKKNNAGKETGCVLLVGVGTLREVTRRSL